MLEVPTLPETTAPVNERRKITRTFAFLVLFIFLRAAGNLSLAWGTKQLPQHLAANPVLYFAAMINPFVTAGIVFLMFSLLTRVALLSLADLSFVLPVTAVGYVISVLLGVSLLHEKVTPIAWVGTFFIFAGAAVVGSTPRIARQKGEKR